MRTLVIVNPAAGTTRMHSSRQRRSTAGMGRHATARAACARLGLDADVAVTERPGHARELAQRARDARADLVLVWGGDGTINEVASALAFSPTPLAIVPGGSGNGLARGLGIPLDPDAAFAVAMNGHERWIDAGDIDGRLFFNVAGVGFDARVAQAFNRGARRGLPLYIWTSLLEAIRYEPAKYRVTGCGGPSSAAPAAVLLDDAPALLVAVANGAQYGSGARIAPAARFDDGRLNVVIIEPRSVLRALVESHHLFDGTIERMRGCTTRAVREVTLSSDQPMLAHVDGEPFRAGTTLRVLVREQALVVRC
ncbi:MAG: diacylglycerol kinase family lipid kinase [Luteitalea sp.]|nr:diacylglycerol kinase family lipid kinase [Luteitalea sp.]